MNQIIQLAHHLISKREKIEGEKHAHACAIFLKPKKATGTVLSIGFNCNRPDNSGPGLHAEQACGQRLPQQSKTIRVHLLSVRTNQRNSSPCCHCLHYLKSLRSKGYKVKNIYYYSEKNQIVKSTISQLFRTANHYVSSGYRRTRRSVPLIRIKIK